jgi:glycosyltransferase involved in cell wall biosynthesis
MKVCMLVFNSALRDGRVMREARTLRAQGHEVHVVGIPEKEAAQPMLTTPDGIVVHRVPWVTASRARMNRTSALRLLPHLTILVLIFLLMPPGWVPLFDVYKRTSTQNGISGVIIGLLALLGIAVLVRLLRGFVARAKLVDKVIGWFKRKPQTKTKIWKRPGTNPGVDGEPFPLIRSRIPRWIPEYVLESALETFNWVGGRFGRFVLYRFRGEFVADYAIALKPDVIHCHDCIALPAGVRVKQALGIPLVYDAHEIYEAAASTRFGITDYYGRIHQCYLPQVDAFVTINKSAAAYYKQAYPYLPTPVIVRNATNRVPAFSYDGRLHETLGLPAETKILLYQGGFTAHRGLPTLIRSAPLLPEGWVLVMMGWGSLEEELKTIARDEKLGARLFFHPGVPQSELHLWSAGASAGIIPYENVVMNHWICSPNKLWEFPIAGVPIIVQPYPELREVVREYACGWLLPEEFSAKAIADAVARLTPDDIALAREGCRRFIEADSWETAYETRLISLYQTIEQGRAVSAGPVGGLLLGHQT